MYFKSVIPVQISKIRAAWLDSDEGAGLETPVATVIKTPFTCCTLRDFAVAGNQDYDVADLVTELGDLEFAKLTDLLEQDYGPSLLLARVDQRSLIVRLRGD